MFVYVRGRPGCVLFPVPIPVRYNKPTNQPGAGPATVPAAGEYPQGAGGGACGQEPDEALPGHAGGFGRRGDGGVRGK